MFSLSITGHKSIGRIAHNFNHAPVQSELAWAIRASAFVAEGGIKRALTSGHTRAIKTGALRSSVRVSYLTRSEARVGPNMEYASYVHEGTRFMRARPFIPAGVNLISSSLHDIMSKAGVKLSVALVK